MRFLIINTPYQEFIDNFYATHPGLDEMPYDDQWIALVRQFFGTLDFYASNLRKLGHYALELAVNCEAMQRQWALENGLNIGKPLKINRLKRGLLPFFKRKNNWFDRVLKAQVMQVKPDILFVHNMHRISAGFLDEVRPHARLIVGQIASPIYKKIDFRKYDLILSSFPHFVARFRDQGLQSEYFRLGFEPQVLNHIKSSGNRKKFIFIGGLSSDHSERIELLEKLVNLQPLDVWGYGKRFLPQKSPIHKVHHGSAWALEMYNIILDADVVLNHHINVAGDFANNMRLFETTGVGTALVTDYKDNLSTLFEPGKEILAYKSTDECNELVTHLLENEQEREAIAKAAQARTLKEHTYFHRMQELLDIIKAYL